MSDLVGNPEDRFSRVAAHIEVGYKGYILQTNYTDDGTGSWCISLTFPMLPDVWLL